ncbi:MULTISPECIES: OmpA/MotB family protein [unclassified Yoonia]|uniref:OmpA/MotB family protein n=1 Tax=unclassified Yoonia TaxID=2629118 RepID=UPI002AFF56D6|nr:MULTISPECIES: flagellar motor protein MotB [unclassified Yoonia]
MAKGANTPTIIKRKKVIAGGGHHGGAWKVAYADFVTAMMAFFMLMWLLNATTEQQRKGIADYFAPTIPINRISGGGSGAFGGDSVFTDETLSQSGTGAAQPTLGAMPVRTEDEAAQDAADAAQVAALQQIEAILMGQGGESLISELALRHVVTRLTDQGLVIEIFDLPDTQLFTDNTSDPNPVMMEIAALLARLFASVSNPVTVTAHLSARPVPLRDDGVWGLSQDRATAMRVMLQDGGLNPLRIVRQIAAGDRQPAVADTTAARNNRLEVILLRSDIR